jgi:hypothetical protein
MKKFKFIMLFMVALGLGLTSCSKDEDSTVDKSPNINFKGGGSYISASANVTVGEEFVIGITASANSSSGEKLTSVKYTVTANNSVVLEADSVFSATSYNVDYAFRMDNAGDAVIKFVVTDKDGETNNISLTITAVPNTTALGSATDFTWERVGGAAGTGLTAFGLKWTANLKAVNAQIKKDGATKFVKLESSTWTSITTVEALEAAVSSGIDMESFAEISVDANGSYDKVLATSYNGEYFLIHITSTTVLVGGSGTTVKIMGQSKK